MERIIKKKLTRIELPSLVSQPLMNPWLPPVLTKSRWRHRRHLRRTILVNDDNRPSGTQLTIFDKEPQFGGRIHFTQIYNHGTTINTAGYTFDADGYAHRKNG